MNNRRLPHRQTLRERIVSLWRTMRLSFIALLFVGGTAAAIVLPLLPRPGTAPLQEGEIAPEDVIAPYDLTYVSDIETQQARDSAVEAVDFIYDDPDPRVGRQQARRAGQILDFIKTVRSDPLADADLKARYLNSIPAFEMQESVADTLVTLGEPQFALVESEMLELFDETMSGPVREDRTEEIIQGLELKVSAEIPDDLVPVVVALAQELIVPNSYRNETATQAARDEAANQVPDYRVSFGQGEIIVRANERLDALDIEALAAYGLQDPEPLSWQVITAAILIGGIVTVLSGGYLRLRYPEWLKQPYHILLFALLVLGFMAAAQALIPGRQTFQFLYPIAALSMVFAAVIGLEFAVLVSILLAVFSAYIGDGSLMLSAYIGAMGITAATSLQRSPRINRYFLAGIASAVAGALILIVFQLNGDADPARLGQLIGVALINGLVSGGLALVLIFLIGTLTEITTSLQLIDLLRPDHPLQKRLQREAVGTYHHILAVANLVEAAAEEIGANSLLTRVGAMYHDIGKVHNPGFFIENRIEGLIDPAFEQLSPEESAQIIIAHVTDGVKMAKSARLPTPVIDFIQQHHGRRPIMFFLAQARERALREDRTLDESKFYYHGPSPQSRETGIIMLGDSCESATRANRPDSEEIIRDTVEKIFNENISLGELNNSGLTLGELKIIKESFIYTLKGMYHNRIRYPEAPDEIDEPAGTALLVEKGNIN